ncbi:RNA polymerase sigma factor [Putridiphycobacter roseus]|uniref:RNA polymerase sigma factor n=1 Tax=Putridiphycobacter roseus TaxID=2219161 RepID=UPI001314C73A|nr:sigma-70 family RNA polymerase sigma factor [Putridiphycobacter roseus]
MENQQELQNIITGCIKGKRKYQKQLFEKYYGKMMGVCMRYARDQDEAQDMVQNGFIKVFEKLTVYNFTGSFEGWVRRIMVNTAIDLIRKNKKNTYAIENEADIASEEENGIIIEEDLNALNFKASKAIEAISNLSAGYKMVFNLYVMEGYTHKEIAEYLGISEGTSKSNLAKAKQKLRASLSAEKVEYHG